ncbi:MAG: T9SS type A sorting domain-containing protein, partial [Planctomycetes bacterium]|nr:T9SS type A sorting domain-containing protein [Planctomycetota bacterium]
DEIAWWESDLFGADFSAEPLTGQAPLTVQFSDLSLLNSPITSWAWDFDNDGTIDSDQQNTVWAYEYPGNYTVSLTIANDSRSDTTIYEDYIRVFDGDSALRFDHENDVAICPASPDLNLTDEVTIEALINPAEWNDMGGIVSKGSISLLLNGQSGQLNQQSLAVMLSTVGSSPGFINTPENLLNLNECQHVAVTYNAVDSEAKLYLDGIEQSTVIIGGQPSGSIIDNSSIDLEIGNPSLTNWTYNGVIDEVRVWNIVRSQEDIQANMEIDLNGDESGLIAYWQMNSGSGSVIIDGSGNNHEGTIDGADWVAGCGGPLAVEGDEDNLAGRLAVFCLEQNYPNPFNPLTTIHYALPMANNVNLSIYDISGKLVKTLVSGRQGADKYSIQWRGTAANGRPVGSGVYLYRLQTDTFDVTKRMVLMK